jgi:hypothetical protein|tara:strand:- start:687 stop:1556 length:870 start_codon:yes stop_codon:yes gene_type:complete
VEIKFSDLIDRHKGKPAVITLYGPSLNTHKDRIIELHNRQDILRFSVNNWYDYFDTQPDYWILSNSEPRFLMKNLIPFIRNRQLPVFYSDDGDFTPKELIRNSLQSEWMAYDQRHWEGKDCKQILKEFKQHHDSNKNFNFTKFGENEIMWHPPRCFSMSGHSLDGLCCKQNLPARIPIQEQLQSLCGSDRHYSTGDTVAVHAIAFAIIMGCNPIYVSGLDLDYSNGYANQEQADWAQKAQGPNAWAPVRKNLENDLDILNESALKKGIEILNLNPKPWYNSFKLSEFNL